MERFYLNTDALKKYLVDLNNMKGKMLDTIKRGNLACSNVINFNDAVIVSARGIMEEISDNVKKMTSTMEKMSDVAIKEYKLYTEYNQEIKL